MARTRQGRQGSPITQEEFELTKKLTTLGLSPGEVAKITKRGRNTVYLLERFSSLAEYRDWTKSIRKVNRDKAAITQVSTPMGVAMEVPSETTDTTEAGITQFAPYYQIAKGLTILGLGSDNRMYTYDTESKSWISL